MRIHDLIHAERFFLSDGGLETYLIFDKGYELPCFSAAVLLESEQGRRDLAEYYERFLDIARQSGRGFVLDAPTWRAGVAWAGPLGQSVSEVLQTNERAVRFVTEIRDRHETDALPILVNGLVGPSGDAYALDETLSYQDALLIHAPQIHALGRAGVDMISAMTLTHAGEAVGMVRAAAEIDIPIVIAFTLETDGRLPSGQSLAEAIGEVDDATGNGPAYYMIKLRPSRSFPRCRGNRWGVDIPGRRHPVERFTHEPCGIG